jgi:PAS domain S-box-containing protein
MTYFKNLRRNPTIKTRLRGLIALIVGFILLLSMFTINGITNIYSKYQDNDQQSFSHLDNLFQITENLYSIGIECKNLIIEEDGSQKKIIVNKINSTFDNIEAVLDGHGHSLTDDNEIKLFNQLLLEYEKYKSINKEILKLTEENKRELALEISNKSESISFRAIQLIIQKLKQKYTENTASNYSEAQSQKTKAVITIITIDILAAVLFFIVSFFLIKDITVAMTQLKENLAILGQGKIPQKEIPVFKDEIGEMAVDFNKLATALKKTGDFANQITSGNYDQTYRPLSQEDLLGNALLNLQESLRIAKEEEDKRKMEETQRNWVAEGLAQFADILRDSSSNFNEFASIILRKIILYVNANQGGLFTYHDNDENNIYLELQTAYAYDRKKYINKTVQLGEGLVGTCAIEKATIYLTELPENYIEIGSGLGASRPSSLLIVPLKIQEDIFGVLEIASFETFPKYQIEFIEKIADNIAVTLSTARINAKTAQLFEESKRQSEILEVQDREMRETLNEMKAAQEEAQMREFEIKGIFNAIDTSLIKAEFLSDGSLITANSNFLRTFGFPIEEITNKSIRDFIDDESFDEFRKGWTKLTEHIPLKGIFKFISQSDKPIWILLTFTPILDENKQLIKIVLLANDITYIKNLTETNKVKQDELKYQINELKNNLAEINQLYKNSIEIKKELSDKLDKTTKNHEKEINSLYEKWKSNLDKSEPLQQKIAQQEQLIVKFNAEMEAANETIEILRKQLMTEQTTIKSPFPENSTIADQHYDKWLKGLTDKKAE